VLDPGEAVRGGDPLRPITKVARAKLDDFVTLTAREMVMMARLAEAKARTCMIVMHAINHARIGKRVEGSIHRRKTKRRVIGTKLDMQRLRGGVVRLTHERLEHDDSLLGDTQIM
jgi:hypothetical protein